MNAPRKPLPSTATDHPGVSVPSETIATHCTECGAAVPVPSDAAPGELIICDHCGVELEVVSMSPVELQIFEEEEK